jgi:hypothetical protein
MRKAVQKHKDKKRQAKNKGYNDQTEIEQISGD